MRSAKPLRGRRVLVTRGMEKVDRLPDLLEKAGAKVVRVPMIATQRLASVGDIRLAVDRLDHGGVGGGRRPWLVLTSATGADLTVDAAGPNRLDDLAIAVVGPATDAALRAHGIEADLVAPGQVGESLAAELAMSGLDGARVLLVTAVGARDVIAPVLTASGAEVEVLEAYGSVLPEDAEERLREVLAGPRLDAVTFTSGSTVRHFGEALTEPLPSCPAVCIGPVTADAARDAGWTTVITAAEHTADGMVAVMVARLARAHRLP
jgi:uroporphyrinogen III methyltransferase / synthase